MEEKAKTAGKPAVDKPKGKPRNRRPVATTLDEPDAKKAAQKAEIFQRLMRLNSKRGIAKFNSVEEMEMLVEQYFSDCAEEQLRPTVRGLAMALGTVYSTLKDWENGTRDHELGVGCSRLVKKAREIIAEYDEQLALAGLDHEVLFMFRGKNYYGMRDTQDVSITPNNPLGDTMSAEDIARSLPKKDVDYGADIVDLEDL